MLGMGCTEFGQKTPVFLNILYIFMELQYKCIPHSVLDTGAFHNRPQPLLLTQGLQVRSDIARIQPPDPHPPTFI